jgi:outer membrane protein, protease secretion system
MKKSFMALAVGLAFATPTAHALDLLHAYESALGNDPVFRAAVKEHEAGQANRVIGRAAVMPKIGLNYNQYANNSQISGPIITGGPSNSTTRAYPSDMVQVQLTQPLFNLAALAQMRQGAAQGDMSEAKFVFQTQELLVRVLQAYCDVLYAEDNLAYLTAQREAYKEQLKVNQRTYEKGEGTVTDALETRASYQMSEAQVIEAQDALENNKRKLEALIGNPIHSAAEVKKLSNNFRVLPLIPRAFELWRDQALANNAELRASDHSVEVARQEYEKQKAAHYPTVAGVVGWNQQKSQTYTAINQQAVTSQAGVIISMPIFSGGEITGRTSQAMANFEKAQAERDSIRERIITELRKQYDLVNSSLQRIEALNRAVDSATELTRAMRKSVQGGQRINLDILLADKGLSTAKRDLAQAKYSYMIAQLKMKQQAGSLNLEDLEKVALNFQKDTAKPQVAKSR